MDSEIQILKQKFLKKIKPTNNFTGKSPKRLGVRITKLLNFIQQFFKAFADTVSYFKDSQLNTFFHDFRNLYITNNKEMIDLFVSKRGGGFVGYGQLIEVIKKTS